MPTVKQLLANDGAHSVFGASSMSRLVRCPGSLQACHGIKKKSSKYADEGNDAHDIVEDCLNGAAEIKDSDIGQVNGLITIDREVQGYLNHYLEYCRSLGTRGPHDPDKDPGIQSYEAVELKVDYSHLMPTGFGTADYVTIIDNVLHVIDFKYGAGIEVDAEENEQLLTYAVAAYDTAVLVYEIEEVWVHVVQPRRFHDSSWKITLERLNLFKATMQATSKLALSKNPPFKAGDKQCQWCARSGNCVTQTESLYEATVNDFDNLEEELDHYQKHGNLDEENDLIDIVGLTGDQVAGLLPNIPMWEKLFKDLKDRAKEDIKDGIAVGDWKLVAGRRGARQWTDAEEAETRMRAKSRILVGDIHPPGPLISPAQAEKLVKEKNIKGLDVSDLVSQKDGQPTLAPGSDKRKALTFEPIEEDFDDEDAITTSFHVERYRKD